MSGALPASAQDPTARFRTIMLGRASDSTGSLELFTSGNAFKTTVIGGATGADWQLTLPTTNGDNGQALTTDGNGVTTWTTITATHAMLSASVTDSTPAAVARGALITGQGGSPTWSLLVIGAANRFLGSDGTDAAWTALTLASAQFANQGTANTVLHGNASGNPTWGVVTPSDAAGNTSGSGNFVLVTSPTLVTPVLGAASYTTLTGGSLTLTNGAAIQTGTTAADTVLFQARDVDGGAYTTLLTMTANNLPSLTATLTDNGTSIVDDVDPTKVAVFQVSGITSATTRTFTLPNVSSTLMALGIAQTVTAALTIDAALNLNQGGSVLNLGATNQIVFDSAGQVAFMSMLSALTPDALAIGVGGTANALHLMERADQGFDYQAFCTTGLGTIACSDPTLILHSRNQDTGEALAFAHDTKAGVIAAGNSTALNGTIRIGGRVVLTGGAASTVVTVPVASGAGTGGKLFYTVWASDGTDHQTRSGTVTYSVVNKAGTETCAVYGVDASFTVNPNQTQDGSGAGTMSTSTLTYTWGVVTTGTNQCELQITAASGLTENALWIEPTLIQSGPGVPTGG